MKPYTRTHMKPSYAWAVPRRTAPVGDYRREYRYVRFRLNVPYELTIALTLENFISHVTYAFHIAYYAHIFPGAEAFRDDTVKVSGGA